MSITQAMSEGFAQISHGNQKDYWKFVTQRSKNVRVVKSSKISILEGFLRKFQAQTHECFRNAMKLCLENPEIKYVEGFVEVHGVPIAHAWNSYRNQHFDVTEEHLSSDSKKFFEMKHIAVAELNQKQLVQFALKTGTTGPYLDLFWSEL